MSIGVGVGRGVWPLLLLGLTACGGGGGGGGGDEPPPATAIISNPDRFTTLDAAAPQLPRNNGVISACPIASAPGTAPTGGGINLSGRVTFERVPFFPAGGAVGIGTGLNYGGIVTLPARGVVVEAIASTGPTCDGTVVDTALTDGNGWYGLAVPAGQGVCVRARAQLFRSGAPGWNLAVVDNTGDNRLYAMIGGDIASAEARPRRDLHAASDHDGTAYTGPRAAAPFAILDTACKAMNAILDVQPGAPFPPLTFRWSVRNTSSEDGSIADGFIGGAFFSMAQQAIYLRGDAAVDTDEFDETVIAHEFAHYATGAFARSDSGGGSHSVLDHLDATVAFDEGWATAFAGLALGTRLYRDSDEVATLNAPSREFRFSIEHPQQNFYEHLRQPGWFNEGSVQQILYDIGDGAADADNDGVSLDFGVLWHAVTGTALAQGSALTTLFSLITVLNTAHPEQAPAIAALLDAEGIDGAVVDAFASAESNAPAAADLPLYAPLGVLGQGGVVQRVCSRNVHGNINRLSNQRYLRFDANAGRYRLRATRVESAGVPGLALLHRGVLQSCSGGLGRREASGGSASVELVCELPAATYVVAAYHVPYLRQEDVAQGPDRCFDISVEAL